jgi:hypothetical protein
MMNKIYRYLMMLVCALAVFACQPSSFVDIEINGPGVNAGARQENVREYNDESRNVLLLYSAGYNSLSQFLADDIADLLGGELPGSGRMEDVLLIYSHFPSVKGAYSVPTSPTLTRVYKDIENNVIKDTLVVYPEGSLSSTASQLNRVLTYVKDNYPAKTYGMVFSSHATGYLPTGYYSNPRGYVYIPPTIVSSADASSGYNDAVGVPYAEPEHDPMLPMVKSVGQDQVGVHGNYLSYEIEIEDFARALPMYMDYILFDACLMGGVEVAYELAGNCGKVGFSQTEVLAEGFDYKTLTSHLLYGGIPDPVAVCKDYYHQYDVQSGVYRSATISMVDCSKMEPLAEVCARLFEKYREAISRLKPSVVQRYYRSDYHWFYDLVDIIAEAGADAGELEELNYAVAECMIYKAATPEFMDSFIIKDYSGFSMYLPSDGSRELDKYYRTLKWNIATGLVE